MQNHNESDRYSSPFVIQSPVQWAPRNGKLIYSTRGNHGFKTGYALHNQNDGINRGRDLPHRVLIEYNLDGLSFDLFTVEDLLNFAQTHKQILIESGESDELETPLENRVRDLRGELSERIARRITKYFLRRLSSSGKMGGLFDSRFDPQDREGYIVRHTPDHILKIAGYPNMVILRSTGEDDYGYTAVKELDGLFDYRFYRQRHLVVLEAKTGALDIEEPKLVSNLFEPLRELFPEAVMTYLLFADKNQLYRKNEYVRTRQLKIKPIKIHEALEQEGINTFFLNFHEVAEDFEKMTTHLVTQYKILTDQEVSLHKCVLTSDSIEVYDAGKAPHVRLVLVDATKGLWRQEMVE
ncbi:hypothetical protein HN587_04955 [Candidatus Woesearchaeota archaeon]|jgi:hypothetical protein|nr:hypothetical protein [Candidatus Woesearchaeota archaeon]